MAGKLHVALHPGQAAIHNSTARFKVVVAGRRFGKSHLAAVELLIEALRPETPWGKPLTDENEVYYVAPTFKQGKEIMEAKIKNIGKFDFEGGVIKDFHKNTGTFTLINGRKIKIRGADDPDSLRGVGLWYVVLDEYADMKPEVWDDIIRPALMDVKGKALFIGTPKGKNHFYKLYKEALLEPDNTTWEAFTFTSHDNPTIDRDELKAVTKVNDERTSTQSVQQEIFAKFVTRGSGTFPDERWVYDTREPRDGYFVVAVDLAGFKQEGNIIKKRDNTAIAVVKITQRGWWIKEIDFGQWGVKETAERIIRAAYKSDASRVGIERGIAQEAVMPYLWDVMKRMSVFYNVEPLSHRNQKKQDRIEWALSGRHEKRRLILNDDPEGMFRPWVDRLLEEAADFPDPLAHDDLLDALAYVDQLGETVFLDDFNTDIPEWEPVDDYAGV